MTWVLFFLTCVIHVVLAQDEAFTLPDNIAIPPELQQQLNSSEIEQAKAKYLDQFKAKCEKNGHPEAYENAKNAVKDLMGCATSLVDMNTLQQEIQEAKPNGKVDEVFKKYCDKTPQFRQCVRNMTETIRPCFSVEEQNNFKILYNVSDQLTEFACFKDGDRIALFIAEGGEECFQQKQEAVRDCVDKTFDSQSQSELKIISLESDFNLEFKDKQCNQMANLQRCIVGALDGCTKSTSANIVDSLFNFIRSATPCKKYKYDRRQTYSAASELPFTSLSILIALAAAMLF